MAAALYNMALRQASSIQSDLTRLSSESPASSSSVALSGQLAASLAAFARTVEDYESMSKREMNDTKKEKALGRVKKFRVDEKEMRERFASLKGRDPKDWTPASSSSNGNGPSIASTSGTSAYASGSARSGAATLESPYSLHARNSGATAGPSSSTGSAYHDQQFQQRPDPLAAYKMNDSAQAMFGGGSSSGNADSPYSVRENHALREHSFIQSTEEQLDAFIAQGQAVWTNLTEQRDILKGTQRRLRDAANTLGLSRNVINAIERRSTQDNVLFVVGAIFTLVCFWYIYKWFG